MIFTPLVLQRTSREKNYTFPWWFSSVHEIFIHEWPAEGWCFVVKGVSYFYFPFLSYTMKLNTTISLLGMQINLFVFQEQKTSLETESGKALPL